MLVLDQESAHETVRELTLKETKDPVERRRLAKIFGFERAKASERIIETSQKHDEMIKQEMQALGLSSDV